MAREYAYDSWVGTRQLTTTANSGTTEFVRVTLVPFDETYATMLANIVTVRTGPTIRGMIYGDESISEI